jgi:hypothetical protein
MTIYRSYYSPPSKVLEALERVLSAHTDSHTEVINRSKRGDALYYDDVRQKYFPDVRSIELEVRRKVSRLKKETLVKVKSIRLSGYVSEGITWDYWEYNMPVRLEISASNREEEMRIGGELAKLLEEIDPEASKASIEEQVSSASSAALSMLSATIAASAVAAIAAARSPR